MPDDLVMCDNPDCPLMLDCYRFMATPDFEYQVYKTFQPDSKGRCANFIELWQFPDDLN